MTGRERHVLFDNKDDLDMLSDLIHETNQKILKLQKKEMKLEALKSVYEAADKSDFDDYLREYAGHTSFGAEDIHVDKNHTGDPVPERAVVEFDFTSDTLDEYDRFEFRNKVVEPVLNLWNAYHPDVEVFVNTDQMEEGKYIINFRYNK